MRNIILFAALALSLSGCTCQTTVEASACIDAWEHCVPQEGEPTRTWTAEAAARFPELAAVVEGLPAGEHGHAAWPNVDANFFWEYWNIDPEANGPRVFLDIDGQLVRVRLVSC